MGFFDLKVQCSICDKTVGWHRYQLRKGVWVCPSCRKALLKKIGGWTKANKLLELSIGDLKKLVYEPQEQSSFENEIKEPEQKAKVYIKDAEQILREQEEGKARRRVYLQSQYDKFNAELNSIPKAEISISGEKRKKNSLAELDEFTFSKITKATKIEKLFPLVVVDVETTGLNKRNCDIIEFSAIKYESNLNEPTSCISTLVNINKPIPEEITKLTGITGDMISDKPYFYEIANSIQDYIKGCNLVGHNLEFDLKFLYVNGIELNEKRRLFDTLEIAKTTLKVEYKHPNNWDVWDYKLDTLCDYYNINRNSAHRSLSDCLATAKLFSEFIDEKQM